MANTIEIKVKLDTSEVEKGTQKIKQSFSSAIDSAKTQVNSLKAATSGLVGVLASLGGIAVFKQIAQFGIDLDKSRNAMTALTGSVDAANKKLAELRKLAQASPGVTSTFATQLFNQLKATREVTDQVINTVIKSLGKLNVVFGTVGPEFVQNLIQIFKTSFERDDVKQAINAVPIFEQLLESAFGTKDPDKLRKAKEAGKLTLDGYLTGLSTAIDTDPRFKQIQESLGGRTVKAFDDVKVKLGELGEKLLQFLLPALEKLIPILNKILDFLNVLPDGLKAATVGAIALAPAISGVTSALGGLRVAFATLGGFLLTPAGIAALAALGVGTAAFALNDLINNQIPRNMANQLNPQGLTAGQGGTFLIPGRDTTLGGLGGAQSAAKSGLDFSALSGSKQKVSAAEREAITKAKEAAKKRAELIKDIQKDILDARKESDTTDLENFAQIAKDVNAANLENIQAGRIREGRPAQLAGFNAANAERLRQIDLESARLQQNTAEKAQKALEKSGALLSNNERFMRGFADATESVGDAFDRFGQSVSGAFRNIGDLFGGLKRAVLSFFNDLLGSALQNLVKSTLGGLFGGGGGGGIGGIFRTPSTFPAALAAASGGGGISAPPSVSQSGFGGILSSIFGGGGGGGSAASTGVSQALSGGGFSFGGLLGGLASAAPLLGLGLGSGLGGTSKLGNVFGAIGGGAIGLGLSFGAGVFGAGGGLAAASLAALGPIALIGAPLIVGAILLGKASQRHKDEEAAGTFQRQAMDSLANLKAAIAGDQIDGSQARQIFESQILGTFVQQINTLKTKSVRDSRLKNQVQDIRNVYEAIIPPEITAQVARRQTSASNAITQSKLIPEFATGGTTIGGLALLHPGEKVVNLTQQSRMRAMAGADVFERAGVPGINQSGRFDAGGTQGSGGLPIEINLQAQVVIGKGDATRIVVIGASTPQGRAVTVKNVGDAKINREL